VSTYLCDSNVWIALSIEVHDHYKAARRWLDSVDEGGSILFCRSTQQSFLRLASNRTVVARYGLEPMTNEQAWEAYGLLLNDSRVGFQAREPEGLERFWREYALRATASHRLWMDAYLAAFARAGGYTLVTTDAVFRQFAGLRLLLLGGEPAA
jgi:toxin-antitoxin system PIN domain toxin